MNWQRTGVVLKKEASDNLRDKRSLTTGMLVPLMGPVLLLMMFVVMGRSASERSEKPLPLPVLGAEHAPSLVSFLKQQDADIQEPPEDPQAAVVAGDVDLVLIIPEDYGEHLAAGRPAPLELLVDDSRQSASPSVRRARRLLEGYGEALGALRLMARGIDPAVVRPLAVTTVDMATPQSQGALLLSMAPYFIIFSIFLGGMYLAIDSTAGERERSSLEPLLLNPVRRSEVVLGKLGATLIFTAIAVVESLVAFWVVLNLVPLEKILGLQLSLGAGPLVSIFWITLPMMLLAAILQILVATFTRSFKEAQTYLSLLPMVPALPGIFLVLLPVKIKLWMMAIPTFGQQLLMLQLMRGEAVEPLHVIVTSLTTLALAALLLVVTIRLYQRERVVFGR